MTFKDKEPVGTVLKNKNSEKSASDTAWYMHRATGNLTMQPAVFFLHHRLGRYPNSNCRNCYGRGYIGWTVGGITIPCRCTRTR